MNARSDKCIADKPSRRFVNLKEKTDCISDNDLFVIAADPLYFLRQSIEKLSSESNCCWSKTE